MKLKRTLSLILAMIMLITCFSGMTITAYAKGKEKSKTINGVEFTYTIKSNEAAINGIYIQKKTKKLVIPEKLGGKQVTSIIGRAFDDYYCIESIVLGDSIKKLGDDVFFDIYAKNISIGKALKTIGVRSFQTCSIEKITISKDNKYFSVKENVLYNKDKTVLYFYFGESKQAKLTIPNSVKEVKAQAFKNTQFTEFKFPDKLAKIGDDSFSGTNIKSVKLPKTVTSIGYAAFSLCESLTKVDISKTKIKSVEKQVFADSAIKSIKLPNTVEKICFEAFRNNDLGKLSLPKSLNKVDTSAFYNAKIKSLDISKDNKSFSTEDGVLYNKDKSVLVSYPTNKSAKSYTAPKSIKSLNKKAFINNQKLQNADLSKTKITTVPRSTFEFSRKLKNVTLPSSCTKIEKKAFFYSSIENINYPKNLTAIETSAFECCSKLKSGDMSSTKTTNIGKLAFDSTAIATLKLPATVKKIDDWAFSNCKNLKDIYIKSKNVKFGVAVFDSYYCENYNWITEEVTYDYPYIFHAPAGSTTKKQAKEYEGSTFIAE